MLQSPMPQRPGLQLRHAVPAASAQSHAVRSCKPDTACPHGGRAKLQHLGSMHAPGLGAASIGLRVPFLAGGESRLELPEEDEELLSGWTAATSRSWGTLTCSMGEAMAAATV